MRIGSEEPIEHWGFLDVKDKIKDSQSKMNASTVETWLINLLVKHTKGQNEGKKYTS